MSRTKEQKIRKLRKAHIWPSILLMILSIWVAALSFCLIFIVNIVNISKERYNSACLNAVSISRSFNKVSGNEQEILDEMSRDEGFSDGVCILAPDGSVIASCGELTYDPDFTSNTMTESTTGTRYIIYADKNDTQSIIDSNGNMSFGLLNTKYIVALSFDPKRHEDVVCNIVFWSGIKLSGDREIILKCYVPLKQIDFLKSLNVCIAMAAVTAVFMSFLFVNIIVSIMNQKRMTDLIYTDHVTGGKSLVYFEHEVSKAVSSSSKKYMVVDITLMRYRNYCNFHGAKAGEALLELVDKTICSFLGSKEVSAHTATSGFALLMKYSDRENGIKRVETIIKKLSETVGDGAMVFHAGIYFIDQSADRYTAPIACLNRASASRGTLAEENESMVAIYDDKILEAQLWEHEVEEKMQNALANEEFRVYIQPKYDPISEKLAGGEALVRWITSEGIVPPGKFIPIFEKNGFITKIDDYMITHVAKLQSEWLKEGKSIVPISVNVSRAHFSNPGLAEHIAELVDKYDVPHNMIEIELTESAFFDDKTLLLNTVRKLGDLGFEISMDDFGAGYSSLNSLKDLPLDVLKLDAEFFRGEAENDRGEIVVSQAISLAKKLNMKIVAEGIEKKEQVDFLASQGCDMIQGYYFAKPMPADEYAQRL